MEESGIHTEFKQKLRSKQIVPMIAQSPPSWIEDDDIRYTDLTRELKRTRFAEFYATAWEKWSLTTGKPASYGNSLKIREYLNGLKNSDAWLQRRLYELITRFGKPLRVPTTTRNVLDQWRLECTDKLEQFREKYYASKR